MVPVDNGDGQGQASSQSQPRAPLRSLRGLAAQPAQPEGTPGGASEVRGDASWGGRAKALCLSSTLRRLRWMHRVLASAVVVFLAFTMPGMLVPTVSACPDLPRAPSSRWRVRADQGVAWLITPCGDRFFSLGVNVVDGGEDPNDRPRYSWKPHFSDLVAFWAATRSRLTSWRFNTLGAYSAPAQVLKLPVTPDFGLGHAAGFHWIDPFHPQMGETMNAWAAYLVGPY